MAEMTKDMYGAVGRLGNRTYYQRGGGSRHHRQS